MDLERSMINKLKEMSMVDFINNCLDMSNGWADCVIQQEEVDCPIDIGLDNHSSCSDCRTCWIEAFTTLKKTEVIRESNNKIILLIGESASGKSSIEKILDDIGSHQKAISDTTRSIRQGEVDGVDYHFISDEKFSERLKNGEYIEHSRYRGWNYAVSREEIINSDKPVVLVLDPTGFRQVKKLDEFQTTSFYIKSSWRTRLKRIVDRGDDMVEIFRRLLSDEGVFQGIEDEVDHIIENDSYGLDNQDDTLTDAVGQILHYMEVN